MDNTETMSPFIEEETEMVFEDKTPTEQEQQLKTLEEEIVVLSLALTEAYEMMLGGL